MAARSLGWTQEQAGELGTLISRSRRLVWTEARRRLEAQGESMLVWQVLNCLRRFGAQTQSEVASYTGQHPAGISRLLDTLEGRRQVRRTRHADDRRKLLVELTTGGQRCLAATDPVLAIAAERVLAPLSASERQLLASLLAKLLGAEAELLHKSRK